MAEVYDNAQSFLGGMNQSIDASLLQKTQYELGVNVSSRKGLIHTRPPFSILGVTFPAGSFQGAAAYQLNSIDRIALGVAGRAYLLDLSTLTLSSALGDGLSTSVDRFSFCQAERYMVIQDGDASDSWADANWPVILDGEDVVDQSVEDDADRVPKGGPMAYGHGRLFVATNYVYSAPAWTDNLGRVGFVAGDIIKAYAPEDLLKFTETQYLNGGGRFVLTEEMGFIRTMAFQKNIASGVGLGPLIVGADVGLSAYLVNAPRAQWQDIDIGTVLYYGPGIGATSEYAFSTHSSDIYYRSGDGIRTLKDTYSRKESSFANDPISGAVQDLVDLDSRDTRGRSSMAIGGNRMLCTVYGEGSTFKGLVSLDMSPYSGLGTDTVPVFDGLWTGLNILQVLSVRNEIYVFYLNDDNSIGLARLDESIVPGVENTKKTKCRIYTGYRFFESPFALKQLKSVDLRVSGLQGDVAVTGYYRGDKYALWSALGTGTIRAGSGLDQRRRRLRLTPISSPGVAPTTNDRLDRAYGFQFCFEWEGKMQIEFVNITAETVTDSFHKLSDEAAVGIDLAAGTDQVSLNDYDYEVL